MPEDDLSTAHWRLSLLHGPWIYLIVGFVNKDHSAPNWESHTVRPYVQHRKHCQYFQHMFPVWPMDSSEKNVQQDTYGDNGYLSIFFGIHTVSRILQTSYSSTQSSVTDINSMSVSRAVLVFDQLYSIRTRFC